MNHEELERLRHAPAVRSIRDEITSHLLKATWKFSSKPPHADKRTIVARVMRPLLKQIIAQAVQAADYGFCCWEMIWEVLDDEFQVPKQTRIFRPTEACSRYVDKCQKFVGVKVGKEINPNTYFFYIVYRPECHPYNGFSHLADCRSSSAHPEGTLATRYLGNDTTEDIAKRLLDSIAIEARRTIGIICRVNWGAKCADAEPVRVRWKMPSAPPAILLNPTEVSILRGLAKANMEISAVALHDTYDGPDSKTTRKHIPRLIGLGYVDQIGKKNQLAITEDGRRKLLTIPEIPV